MYSSVWRCLHCDSHVKVRLTETETETQRDREIKGERDRERKRERKRMNDRDRQTDPSAHIFKSYGGFCQSFALPASFFG